MRYVAIGQETALACFSEFGSLSGRGMDFRSENVDDQKRRPGVKASEAKNSP